MPEASVGPGVAAAITAVDSRAGDLILLDGAGTVTGRLRLPGTLAAAVGDGAVFVPGQALAGFRGTQGAYHDVAAGDRTVVWSTLFGGSREDAAEAVQRVYGGCETLGPLAYGDAFLARFDSRGARLEYSTYLGGTRYDMATVLVAAGGGVVVAGVTADGYQRALTNLAMAMPGTQRISGRKRSSRPPARVPARTGMWPCRWWRRTRLPASICRHWAI